MSDSGKNGFVRNAIFGRKIAVNEQGVRIGEDHPRAKLTDHEVELIRQLLDEADEQKARGEKYLKDCEIAEKFEISKAQLHNIRYYRERAQTPARHKLVSA